MSKVDIEEVTRGLEKTSVGESGVSFKGKSLKLDREEDATEVATAINACSNLHFLNLEGNSVGIDAAKAIGKALESHGELKRAEWKDMFTGRTKEEIPKAIQYLGGGLMLANTRLTELDLSDNAFGPVGIESLLVLLKSPTCYTLQVLKLNNNGLGITGGEMLSKGLLECYNKSEANGKPLALRVFIAGRNRLEDEGAKALAEVFRKVGTLEELCMPQNGIYHGGISVLAEALKCNPNLQVLNLNDNLVTTKGVAALVNMLPALQKLKELDLGDCLLKTEGAINLATALSQSHQHLEKLLLECNEIGPKGGLELAKAMRNKTCLKQLMLNGNEFGSQGRADLCAELKNNGHFSALGSLEDDEDEDGEDDNEEDGEDEYDNQEESVGDGCNVSFSNDTGVFKEENNSMNEKIYVSNTLQTVTIKQFLQNPTPEKLLGLGSDRSQHLLQEVLKAPKEKFLETILPILMQVSSCSISKIEQVCQAAFSCSYVLYEELFKWAKKNDEFSMVNNALLVHLGLIKSEDKSLKLTWNLGGCMLALERAMEKDFFPHDTQEIIQVFRCRRVIDVENGKIVSF